MPCLLSFIITPLAVYLLVSPEIKTTPSAPLAATEQLKTMGKMTIREWGMVVTMLLLRSLGCRFMWIRPPQHLSDYQYFY
ncbi:anion permease [Salmonella enterica]|nr:anion permease [Salmonella enterica]